MVKDASLIEETIRDCFEARDVAAGLVADVNQRGIRVRVRVRVSIGVSVRVWYGS